MARSDWDIRGIIVYKEEFEDDPLYGMKMDIYNYSFFEMTDYIPILLIKKLLRISEQKFVDILNEDITSKKHLITNYEEQFRAERTTTYGYKSLFTKEQVFGGIPDLSVELADFEDWLDDNYELLKENKATPKEDCCLSDIDAMQSRIAELEAENTKLRIENEELKKVSPSSEETGENTSCDDFPAEYEGHGIFTMVAKLVDARASVAEIMAALDNEKEFLSRRENGYFFHPKPNGYASDTLRKYAARTMQRGRTK